MSALSAAPARKAQKSCHSGTETRHNLFVEINAHSDSLARITNLMAKLGILPRRFETMLDPLTNMLEVRIETGTDAEACERLRQRLLGMVAVGRVQVVTVPSQVTVLGPLHQNALRTA